ncbi:MAG: cytochrome c oxidase assembly protein [Quadrisphaera sp.]
MVQQVVVGAATTVLGPLTPSAALGTWTVDPAAVAVAVLLLACQLWLVRRARSGGHRWPWWRTAVGAVLGPGVLLLASCSFLAVYREVAFWPGALASALLLVLVPAGIAVGDPLRLLRLAGVLPPRQDDDAGRRLTRRVLALPAVGALAGVALQLALFLSPWWAATLRSGAVRSGTGLALVAVGTLFALPVFAADDGPGTGGTSGAAGLRVLLAFVDGVVDAVPGLVVGVSGAAVAGGWYVAHRLPGSMTAPQDQLLGGTLSVVVAEVVAVPLLLLACRRWARADAAQAAREDALLDALERGGPAVTDR